MLSGTKQMRSRRKNAARTATGAGDHQRVGGAGGAVLLVRPLKLEGLTDEDGLHQPIL
jgi:hypothetical protein